MRRVANCACNTKKMLPPIPNLAGAKPSWRLTPVWATIVVAALTVAAYINTLPNPLVWDDTMLVQRNNYIRNTSYIPAAFSTDLFHGDSDWDATHYRPLQTLTYMWDYAWWGTKATGYHLTNLLLQLGCALLVLALLRSWFRHLGLAFGVAAVFAVHPINTNAISYVAGRADPLAFFWMLVSLWLLDHRERRKLENRAAAWVWYVGSLLAFVAALFSRENAALLPALVWLYGAWVREPCRTDWRAGFRLAIPFVVLAVGFFLLRHEAIGWLDRATRSVWHLPAGMRVQVFFRALATYIGLFFWPARLQTQREVIFSTPLLTVAGIGGALLLVAALRWAWRRSRPAVVGWFWFVITLAPMLGIVRLNATVAEHWAYVPSIGFYLLAGGLWLAWRDCCPRFQSANATRLAVCVFGVVVAALTTRTVIRNRDWSEATVFYKAVVTAVPQNATAHCNLGNHLLARGETDSALACLLEAERLAPGFAAAKTRLAKYYLEKGKLELAQTKAVESLALQPRSTLTLLLAAKICEAQNDLPGAARFFLRATGSTINVRPWIEYGEFLIRHTRARDAAAIGEEALWLEPGCADAWNLRGIALAEMGDTTNARICFVRARECDRHSPDGWLNLGRLALRQDNFNEAAVCFENAVRIAPEEIRGRYQLAVTRWKQGRPEAAEAELVGALAAQPESARIRATLAALRRREPNPFSSAKLNHD